MKGFKNRMLELGIVISILLTVSLVWIQRQRAEVQRIWSGSYLTELFNALPASVKDDHQVGITLYDRYVEVRVVAKSDEEFADAMKALQRLDHPKVVHLSVTREGVRLPNPRPKITPTR